MPSDRNIAIVARKSDDAQDAGRVALVIGNSDYRDSPLKNPVNDAKDMAQALEGMGFRVTLQLDATRLEMKKGIRRFGNLLRRAEEGLFYYAGHGIQIKGKNYLVPVGTDIEAEDEIEDEAVEASLVLRKMESAGSQVNIVILDACRNNPFERSFRSATRGLAQMDAPGGSLIVYATAPGSVAADGRDRNGIFTKHLLDHIRNASSMEISRLLRSVRVEVEKDTGGSQIPWESSSLRHDFYFKPAPSEEPEKQAEAKGEQPVDEDDLEDYLPIETKTAKKPPDAALQDSLQPISPGDSVWQAYDIPEPAEPASKKSFKVELNVMHGPFKGKNLIFAKYDKISIGRFEKCYFSLPHDKKISRYHCLIELLPPSRCFLKDLDSSNGTFLRRPPAEEYQKISEAHLQNGDHVKMGDTVFRITFPKGTPKDVTCEGCGAAVTGGRGAPGDTQRLCAKCTAVGKIAVGSQIGTFEVLDKLGEGNMGPVYKVRHLKSEHLFAVKIAHPEIAPDDSQVQRFLREAACGSQIKHEHILRYYPAEYIAQANFFFIPMEYVQGMDFRTYLLRTKRPIPLRKARTPVLQFLDGLEFLHQNKIVHRNITPSNLLLAEKDGKHVVKLADFGLAKNYEEAGLSGLTLSHHVQDAHYYMSPEQCASARDVDPRADIYSAAATIYTLLTNRVIYEKSGKVHILTRIMSQKPVPIEKVVSDIPQEVSALVMRCLDKDPANRIQTTRELKEKFAAISGSKR